MKETLSQLEYLFKQITQHSEENIQKYSLLTPTARKHLPDVKESLDGTWIGSVHEHFHNNAIKNPDKIAAVHKTDTLTYLSHCDCWLVMTLFADTKNWISGLQSLRIT